MNEENARTITFLNFSGDITLSWSEEQDETVEKLIAEKLKEGHSFFSIQNNQGIKRFFKKESKVKVDSIKDIERREIIMKSVDDEQIAQFIRNNPVGVFNMSMNDMKTVEKLKTPQEIAKSNTIATRPIFGG